jgi:hypothetical protein
MVHSAHYCMPHESSAAEIAVSSHDFAPRRDDHENLELIDVSYQGFSANVYRAPSVVVDSGPRPIHWLRSVSPISMQRTLFPMRAFLVVDVTTCFLTAAARTKVGKLMMLAQNPARWLSDTGSPFAPGLPPRLDMTTILAVAAK